MPRNNLDQRTRLAIELALSPCSDDAERRRQLEEDARSLGMVGAEIDAVRNGRSFDVRTSRALALATAADEPTRQRRRGDATLAGLDADACREIEDLAADITGGRIRADGNG